MSAQNLSTATVRSISLLWLQLAWTRPQDVKADGFSCAYLCQPNYPLIGYWMVILSAFQSARKGYKVSLLQFESHLLVSYLAMIHTGSNGIISYLISYYYHIPLIVYATQTDRTSTTSHVSFQAPGDLCKECSYHRYL